MMMDLGPLYNPEAEQSLLGAVMINNRAYWRINEKLSDAHFGNALHGRIYAGLAQLIERNNAANPATLKPYFEVDPALSEVGGFTYLMRLADAGTLVIDVADYAQIIRELYLRRQLLALADDLRQAAAKPDIDNPVDTVIAHAENELYQLAEHGNTGKAALPIAAVGTQALQETERAYKAGGKLGGVSTGLGSLDRILQGLLPGDLEVLASRPAMGKTAFALGIARHAAQHGIPVVIFELEQTGVQLAQRLLADTLPIERQRLGDIDSAQFQALFDAQERLAKLPLWIDDSAALSVAEIRGRARALKRRQQIGLVVIDHLQLIRAGIRAEARRLEIGHITSTLKQLAKELDIPVLLLSQLNRGVETRDNKRPMLADLRESGDIEQDADRVIFLYRDSYYLEREQPQRRGDETQERFAQRFQVWEDACAAANGIAEIIVAKDRHGGGGAVRVHWDPIRMRFTELMPLGSGH